MRVDPPLAESLEPAAGHEALPRKLLTAVAKDLMIDVNGRLRFGGQHAFAPPIREELSRPRIAIVCGIVPRLVAIEDQADDIRRVSFVELALQIGADHVVWRRHDLRQRSDVLEVVTQSAKGLNLGHGDGALE